MLINFLQNHAVGKRKCKDPTRITAALGLLRKVLPDLAQIEGTITHEWEEFDSIEIQRQVAATLTSSPQLLVDILRSDPLAKQAVERALAQLNAIEAPAPALLEHDEPSPT